jgi:arylsulfatase A-like enzyme
VVHAPVSTAIDITATCLAVAGAQATRPQDGVSLTTHADPKRVTRGSCAKVPGAKPEVPTNDWIIADLGDGLRKVIRYHGATGADAVEAYDLDTDPHELVNWGNDPARQDERATLLKELDAQLA